LFMFIIQNKSDENETLQWLVLVALHDFLDLDTKMPV
jgi:hypothetical protein